MSREHPVNQVIERVTVSHDDILPDRSWYGVGVHGVTRIEATTKSGMHADIPYIRVWAGEMAVAEFCQHSVISVLFSRWPPQDPKG